MSYIRQFLRQDRDYFRVCAAEIRRQNVKVLRMACVLYMAVLAAYSTIAFLAREAFVLCVLFIIFDAIHIALCVVVFGVAGRHCEERVSFWCRVAFEASVLTFFLLAEVFAHPAQHSVYFCFPIILIVMMFTYRAWRAALTVVADVAVFVALSCLFKTPEASRGDIYLAAATLISALGGYFIVAGLRHETGSALGRLNYLSMTDPMTHLYNKQTLKSLSEAYMRDEQNKKGYALLFFDVDRFKLINDRYGHPFGDRVLTSIADVMLKSFYEKDYMSRFGGDEFVVFMVDICSEADVNARVEIFRQNVRTLGSELGMDDLSLSVGVAVKAPEPESYEELLSRADAALYVAKENGGATRSALNVAGDVGETEDRRLVLIVDDNAINRRVLHKIVSMRYGVVEAKNGAEALKILRDRHAELSAVLLDIVMPVMDGYEVLKHIRKNDALRTLPVIVTTGFGEEEAELRALTLGANDFVVKPYRPAIIMHRLQNTIELREASERLAERPQTTEE